MCIRDRGDVRVTLTVRDNRGAVASVSNSITVTESRPTAAFTFSPSSPAVGTSVFFDASTSRASTGREIVSYGWSFGDGGTGSGVTTRHTYSAAGVYNVALTVTDNIGEFGTVSQTVTVGGTGTGPVASFNVSPEPSVVNQNVVVDARPSTPSPGATIIRYSWNWGDGTTINDTSDPTYSHTYNRTGVFTITLTVTDSFGRTATTTKSHTVN